MGMGVPLLGVPGISPLHPQHPCIRLGMRDYHRNAKLGGGNSNIFYFHPETLGKWSNLTVAYFSTGLKPPTRKRPGKNKAWNVWKNCSSSCRFLVFFPQAQFPRDDLQSAKLGRYGLQLCPFGYKFTWTTILKGPSHFPWNTGWLIGILTMAYYNPHITG